MCVSSSAIIGGGIGGTAAAFFLRQEFGPAVKIDVFEAGTVGGRLATENIGGHEYETGGSVIHPLNLHMKHFLDKLGQYPLLSPAFLIFLIHSPAERTNLVMSRALELHQKL